VSHKTDCQIIVKKAGSYLLSHFGKAVTQTTKKGKHYHTLEDKIVSDIYKHFLTLKYPSYGFSSEEEPSSASSHKYYWLVDPIEGTTNFSRGIPLFATQIALIHNEKVVVGCVYLPIQNEFYYAELDRGSTCNGLPLSFSSNTSLVESVMSIGKGTDSDNLAWWGQSVSLLSPQVRTIRLLGATGIELCYLASGKIDLYLNYGSKPYDYAPGSLIAKEAGANVCNFDQKSWSIKNSDIIVGNKKIINESIILLKGK